jgi:DNA-3-methyladenine glycosylase II
VIASVFFHVKENGGLHCGKEIPIVHPARPLTKESFQQGLTLLAARDRDLAWVVDRYGPPPMWARKPGFATLVRIILEQQVSLASARAAYQRLAIVVSPFSATRFRQIDPALIQQAGLTRQKRAYCFHLAEAIARGELRLGHLPHLTDDAVRQQLMQVKGIGRWTADIYLLMALRRTDIWPRGDLALKAALQSVKHLPALPTDTAFEAMGRPWRPWRAIAARILWHTYLSARHGPF